MSLVNNEILTQYQANDNQETWDAQQDYFHPQYSTLNTALVPKQLSGSADSLK